MKASHSVLLLTLLLSTAAGLKPAYAQDPVAEAIKAGVKKVIVALDLQVQRIQNETIWLQNAQKVLENKLSELRLTEISEWSERQRRLYADYYDELWQVKQAIATYRQVREIITLQAALVSEYRRAYGLFRQDGHLSPAELEYLYRVYAGILSESIQHLDQALLVTSSFATQMSDGERLSRLEAAAAGIRQHYSDLRRFNAGQLQLCLQRAREQGDLEAVQRLYGIITNN
ncbi:conjugal transfer protein TraI [Pontibacter sp. HSC-14F20]|uniref:conjugal transfer protein TraI n=1 Tax=Pontibacter sp. HSC-14F20 TaxID=2864136 RepID=UPI001C7395C1|nr:conjugal transfer protein TraI [Pontibacter sp. HSC-14F20]MBX0335368.1 conjugal transfer protein TraI [Pontibacter sp. HSC-14F20]